VDAAYGGFFCSLPKDDETVINDTIINALNSIKLDNSFTIDPHKLGYVPYSSGAFICKSKREYFSQKTDASYINFDKNKHKGTQTLEGSRSASGAVST
jgi:glutamate/tyrosine decarboxylase-like PLP-dependent enzyme